MTDDKSDCSSSEDEELLLLHLAKKKRRKPKQVWIRPIFKKRKEQGDYHNLLQELRLNDTESHFRYLRMSKERFDLLLSMVGPHLHHQHYHSTVRAEISPTERLVLTIQYLATGNSQVSMSFSFRVGRSTDCYILEETCKVIYRVLMKDYLKPLSCAADWEAISKDFYQRWNFPNCLGAIDGKHIVMQAPSNCGSLYYNYKGTHSVVLLAVCDAQYRFTLIDLGLPGRFSDSGVLSNCSFGNMIVNGDRTFPPKKPLPGTRAPSLPFVIVGDEASSLQQNLLRPYPGLIFLEQTIFNYRLSRARRISENSFGILAARWRILRRLSQARLWCTCRQQLHCINTYIQPNPVCIALLGLLMGRMMKAALSLGAGDQTKNHVWECNQYPTLAAIDTPGLLQTTVIYSYRILIAQREKCSGSMLMFVVHSETLFNTCTNHHKFNFVHNQ